MNVFGYVNDDKLVELVTDVHSSVCWPTRNKWVYYLSKRTYVNNVGYLNGISAFATGRFSLCLDVDGVQIRRRDRVLTVRRHMNTIPSPRHKRPGKISNIRPKERVRVGKYARVHSATVQLRTERRSAFANVSINFVKKMAVVIRAVAITNVVRNCRGYNTAERARVFNRIIVIKNRAYN